MTISLMTISLMAGHRVRSDGSCRVVWRGVAWCGVAWRGVAWRGVAWRGVAWRGVAWRGVAQMCIHAGVPQTDGQTDNILFTLRAGYLVP